MGVAGAMGAMGAVGAIGAAGAVALGGAIGSLARHGVNAAFSQWLGRPTPYATAVVNLIGSAMIGVLAGLIASGKLTMTPNMRAFVFVGLLGGFTTFSSFMLDTLTLTHGAERTLALSNVVGQTIIGLVFVYVGYSLAAN